MAGTVSVPRQRLVFIVGLAIAMTTLAEIFYLLVWGLWLFPGGNLLGKIIWTLTCGLAMGSVIAAATLLWIEGRHSGLAGLWRAAVIVAAVGSYCAILCSAIDTRFNYFGGAEHANFFVIGGIVPAALGGLLYGWLIYGGEKPTPALTAGEDDG